MMLHIFIILEGFMIFGYVFSASISNRSYLKKSMEDSFIRDISSNYGSMQLKDMEKILSSHPLQRISLLMHFILINKNSSQNDLNLIKTTITLPNKNTSKLLSKTSSQKEISMIDYGPNISINLKDIIDTENVSSTSKQFNETSTSTEKLISEKEREPSTFPIRTMNIPVSVFSRKISTVPTMLINEKTSNSAIINTKTSQDFPRTTQMALNTTSGPTITSQFFSIPIESTEHVDTVKLTEMSSILTSINTKPLTLSSVKNIEHTPNVSSTAETKIRISGTTIMPTRVTTVNWNKWCQTQCILGKAGDTCCCDIAP